MNKTFLLLLLILGLIGAVGIDPTPGNTRRFWGLMRQSSLAASQLLQLTGFQLLFGGQPVDQVVSGKKIKKYSIEVMGMGFLPDSNVVVNSVRAFGEGPGEPPQQPVSTMYISSTNLEAAFLPGIAPPQGILVVKVVNPGGEESNSLTADVISKPSKLSIDSISPQSGPVGTQVALMGTGLAPRGVQNPVAIRFSAVGDNEIYFEGFYTDSTGDESRLELVVPNRVILPICPGGPFVCDPISIPPITPQDYRVWVINSNGMSNSILFRVTSS